jgi:hypothetical protein
MMMSMGLQSQPSSITFGDFNGDTQRDIAVANYGTKNVGMLLRNGKGTLTSQTMVDIGFIFAPTLIASGDFDNDGESEIVVAYDGSDDVDILVAYNSGSFINGKTYSTGLTPFSVAVDDFNNDTQLDIVVANFDSNDVSVLLGNGNGSFAS